MTSLAPLISGAAGGTISTVLLLPLDNIKVRLQVNEGSSSSSNSSSKTSAGHTNISASSISATHQHPSPPPQRQKQRLGSIAVLRGIVRHEGVRGLYQGLVPSVIGNGTSWGGFFFIYETLKLQLRQHKQQQHRQKGMDDGENETLVTDNDKSTLPTLNSWENFQVATASGMALVFMTNPIWLVKLRMQLQMKHASEQLKNMSVSSSVTSTITETETAKKTNIAQYNGFIDAIKTIVREEGFWALYKGTGPALLLTSHGGVQFVVYEFLRKHFHFARATATASQEQQRKQQRKQQQQQQQDTNKNNDRNRHTTTTSVWYRFENSLGYLTMGAVSKM
jgi:solute carrier family 25 folate transporter 32